MAASHIFNFRNYQVELFRLYLETLLLLDRDKFPPPAKFIRFPGMPRYDIETIRKDASTKIVIKFQHRVVLDGILADQFSFRPGLGFTTYPI
jgi:hypothetical protein